MEDKTDFFPARLHIVFAREKNIGVVFRRGPSKQVCTFLWDRETDEFQIGQWLKGRIYERRTDLSPDGQHMIYFAMNGKWQSETRGSWTAISRTPYLKALDLYAKGDCWQGGGLFLSGDKYWLNDQYFFEDNVLQQDSRFDCDRTYRPESNFGAECTGVYYPRLLRDGWSLVEHSDGSKWNTKAIFEKPLPQDWVLRKIAHEQVGAPVGKGCYWDEHELYNSASDTLMTFPDWEWADWDRGSLVWAEAGKLFRAGLDGKADLKPAALLHDFNGYEFEPIAAPY